MSHFNGGIDIDPAQPKLNGSLPKQLPYDNGSIDREEDDEYMRLQSGVYTNGYILDGHEPVSAFPVVLELTENEKRFGFSVVGGVDEGFRPRIDEIVEGLPAARMGVRIGDEIERVNDKSVRYSTHAQIVTTIHESVREGRITLTLRRINLPMPDDTNSLPARGRLSNRNNNVNDLHANMSDKTRAKLENIIRNQGRTSPPTHNGGRLPSHDNTPTGSLEHRHNGSRESPQHKMSPTGSYTSGSTLSLNHHGNANTSPLRTIDHAFVGMDNYGYDWRKSHMYGVTAPEYNEAVHGPSRMSYMSSVGSDDTSVAIMDSKDCQAVVSTLMRHATNVDDEQLMDDLRILESSLRTRHFRNALSVQCKIMELENLGRGPHFVSAQRDDASVIRAQVTNFIANQRVLSSEAKELAKILDSANVKELLMAHDRAAKIERPNFTESEQSAGFDRTDSYRISHDRISADRMSTEEDEQVKIVKIEKADEPLGATVRNEGTAVVIGRIVTGGAAQKSGLLREGDEIIEINGVNMRGKTVEEVCELLADMNGTLTFLIKPSNRSQHNLYTSAELHVRALFDYNPNEDEFIPCRELGLAFSKRDILHIVNQDDTNWWQAWREGTSGQELAGLIPGKNFQKQREKLNTKGRNKEERKTTSCGCFGRSRGKKSLRNSDSEDEDDILTYEEVGLLQPSRNQKRPVVLIGPTKIGRRELRQRLLQVAPERFGSAVPHTSRRQEKGEMDGKEYRFITRHHFKEFVSTGKFVEHGEYDGHFYGTSLDSIKQVIDSGKVCVVNLHCQALKILRDSKLKPYVVFICPPNVEKIKRLRRGHMDSFNPSAKLSTDEELLDMVMSARDMEDNYGHYFDQIIVNTDLERTFDELIKAINELESKPQWVPVRWVRPA